MRQHRPRRDSQRLAFLEALTEQATLDSENGTPVLEEMLYARARDLRDRFARYQKEAARTGTRRKEAIEVKNRCVTKLDRTIRDFRASLERRTRREEHTRAILAWFKLASIKRVTRSTREKELLTDADVLISGDARATEAGYPPMTNPSAKDLAVCRQAAERALIEVNRAIRDHEAVRGTLVKSRKEIAELIRTITFYLSYKLADKTPSQRRKTMRLYGFRFSSDHSEESRAGATEPAE